MLCVGVGEGVREVVGDKEIDNVVVGEILPLSVAVGVNVDVVVAVSVDPYEGVTDVEGVTVWERVLVRLLVDDIVLDNVIVTVTDGVVDRVLLADFVLDAVAVGVSDCVKYSEFESEVEAEREVDPEYVVVVENVGVMVRLMDGVRPGVKLAEMAGNGDALGIVVTAAEVMFPIPACK